MVKPVFQAASQMRSAETADAALDIALRFLSSPAAEHVKRDQAGTLLNAAKDVFVAHRAPVHYGQMLDLAIENPRISADLQQLAHFALIDFKAETSGNVLGAIRNAKVLDGVRAALSATPEARNVPDEETISLPFAALYSARNYAGLKSQINHVLMEKDVDDSEAEGCMKIFLIMSRRLGLMVAQRDELLQFIMDQSSEKDKLYQLAADAQIQEGAPPKSAHNLGRGLDMS